MKLLVVSFILSFFLFCNSLYMKAFEYKRLKVISFLDTTPNTYLVVLLGAILSNGIVLLCIKFVMRWMNMNQTTLHGSEKAPQ